MLVKGKSALVTGAGSVRVPLSLLSPVPSPPNPSVFRARASRGDSPFDRLRASTRRLILPPSPPPTQGIGRGLSLRLAREGVSGLTLVDVSRDATAETAASVAAANPDCAVEVVVADVSDPASLKAAFASHLRRHGALHLCFNNAGVGEREDWRSVVDINLNAVVHGTRLAIDAMTSSGAASPEAPASVVNVASAGGVFPMPQAPVYSATKAAVVLFSKSLAHLARTRGVRVNALCPQFTDTALVSGQFAEVGRAKAETLLAQTGGKLLTVEQVVDAAMELVRDDRKAGEALAVMNARGGVAAYVPAPNPKFWKPVPGLAAAARASVSETAAKRVAPSPLPPTFRKVVVRTLTADFAAATAIETVPMIRPRPGEVLIERLWTGVNASDVNFTAGRYFGGAKKAAAMLPFDAGFESVGIVAALGEGVTRSHPELVLGAPVATTTFGGFSEYAVADAKVCVSVPEATPRMLALLTSGLTASLALEQAGGVPLPEEYLTSGAPRKTEGGKKRERRKTVLVTAAAGGTGQIAAQLAKLAGHVVIATCGGGAKVDLLRRLGVDRVVNYREEKLRDVLKREFPRGIDIAYESVGGDFFAAALDALAPGGRVIVIGMMSQYTAGGDGAEDAWTPSNHPGLPEKLLWKSGACVGFFLPHYARHFRRHLAALSRLLAGGRLRVEIDPTPFVGLESTARAVAHLQGGKSIGKVVVDVAANRNAREGLIAASRL